MISPVCCWQDQKIQWESLKRHYDSCSAINGQWAFWVCAYDGKIFDCPKRFKSWLLRFKQRDDYIEIIKGRYTTVEAWVTDLKELAMKRHLMAMLLEIKEIDTAFWERWVALNGGEELPQLNGLTDLPETLRQCSQLIRTRDSISDHDFAISGLIRSLHIDVPADNTLQPQTDALIYTDTTHPAPGNDSLPGHVLDEGWHSGALDDTQMDLRMEDPIDTHGFFSVGTPNQSQLEPTAADNEMNSETDNETNNEMNEDMPAVYRWQRHH
jgi:hypothetical protein